jgi:flagellar biosynthesis/type III secretory pathway M-ring protein FliF/YscJ
MDFRQQLNRISDQLGGLSASQKMLTVCLFAIMLITLVWWGRYAATPEMVPVLDRSISGGELASVKAVLQGAGIAPRVVNDRILVPAERHVEALAALTYARALPHDSVDAWDEIVKQSSPWETSEKTSAMFNRAKEKVLSQVIRSWSGLTSAQVLINPTIQRRIGGAGNLEASASVILQARPDAEVRHLVDAAAATVANSVSGLKVANVSVVVNGRPHRPRDAQHGDPLAGVEQYEIIQKQEEYYINKIRDAIPFATALITVSVEVDTSSSQETKETYDAKNTLSKERSVEQETSETQGAAPAAAAEPGATANMGLSAESGASAATSGQGGSTTTERSRTEMEILPSKLTEQIRKPGGKHRVTRASVRLPLSHFVNLYRRDTSKSAAEPSDADLQPLIKAEIEEVRNQVLASCGMSGEQAAQNVTVAPYDDRLAPPMAAASETVANASAAGASASVTGTLTRHAKEIAIGVLALVSLFMVSGMVRRGATVSTIAQPVELRAAAPLAVDEDVAGEVGEGGAMLDGMELDEDTIKAQQMVEQVSTLVKENPDSAANLVKRWLNRN